MGTSHQGGDTSFPKFPIQALLRTMRHLVGGRVSEGSGIYFVFVSNLSKPILLSLMTFYLVSLCIVVCFVCEVVSLFLKCIKYSLFF